ncbi:hypothetical protein XELAEV_18017143mg [Xenopus laevis]|uniref:Uncharacterized protein n=1 Tax=Xenopus laevis TaxID=8355 RepID=A0A974DCT1_XENLA|nr:hypothetical protein XELAEV_18017143mg [Xenopus laevis]
MRRSQKTNPPSTSQRTTLSKKDKEIAQFFAKNPPSPSVDGSPKMADTELHEGDLPDPITDTQFSSTLPDATTLLQMIAALPQKGDLSALLADIKQSQQQETLVLQNEIQGLHTKLQDLECRHSDLSHVVKANSARLSTQARHIFNLRRLQEDAENRSHRCKLCIRGIPASIENADLHHNLMGLFQHLLDQEPGTDILIDRPNKPKDVLCTFHSFSVKEKILRRARELKELHLEDTAFEIYQDLAYTTVLQCCMLRNVVNHLKELNVPYKWGFPFALLAHKDGKTFILKEPADLVPFSRNLGLPPIDIQDWNRFVCPDEPSADAPTVSTEPPIGGKVLDPQIPATPDLT